ncbi:hypothetical protein [Streptomyces sp. NBC_00847]|uniref:hypothetical protein n=1 Tax=unclassified Streptomyces TaxID=2593676 RepID=UPI0022575056|nr:hypothetical protein [Streptomyces sp. NBC_00847]MCX4879669.1 hypothetical protein [Streptomyces sp. NBC_00847]
MCSDGAPARTEPRGAVPTSDQVQPAQGPGAGGPGPDGAGFTYRGAEQELIVVASAETRLRARTEGVRSAAGADVSALNMFLGDEQLVLQPLFGSEERLQQSTPTPGDQNVPDLALFYRVRGGESRAQEPRSRIAALPGIDTAYVKPGAVPATVADDDRRLKEGAPVTPDFSSRQGCLGPAPEGIDPTGHGSGPLAEGPAQRPRPAGLSAA